MNVIITGGTGLVGRAVVVELLDRGDDVCVWSRDAEQAMKELPAATRVAAWNPLAVDPAALAEADAVVHLAGAGIADARWTEKRKALLRSSRIETAAALVRGIESLPSAERPRVLVSASAVGFYGDRQDEMLTERSEGGTGFLAQICRDWEAQIFAAQQAGPRCVALRLGMVLARDGGALPRMLLLFRLGLGGTLGDGCQWMSWIHVHDLASLVCWALDTETVSGPVNAVAPGAVRNAEFTRVLARTLRRPAFLRVPKLALRIGLGEMSNVLLASQRVVPAVAESGDFAFCYPRLGVALRDLCRRSTA